MPKITDFEPDALAELLASIGKADAKVFCKNVQSCEAILTEAATKGHLEHVRESVEALQYTVRIRPTFGISPPCPQNLQISSVTQTRARPD